MFLKVEYVHIVSCSFFHNMYSVDAVGEAVFLQHFAKVSDSTFAYNL